MQHKNIIDTNLSKSTDVYCYKNCNYEDENKLMLVIGQIFENCECTKKLCQTSNVLIKPNLLAKHAPEYAVTTHPAILKAVILTCIEHGVLPQNITVADSPGGLYNRPLLTGMIKTAGFAKVCEETGVQFYTECKSSFATVNGSVLNSINFINPVKQANFIINLPKLKTHVMTGMTCAVKNLFGTIPGLEKAELHTRFAKKEQFGQMLCDVCEAVNADLHIVDAVLAHEGDGPSGGTPKKLGLIYGGENPYSTDAVSAKIIGINADLVPYMQAAKQRGLCNYDAEFVEKTIKGEQDAANCISDFKLPSSFGSVDFSLRVAKPFRPIANFVINAIVKKPVIEKQKCIGCAKCKEICPAKTINMYDNGKKAKIAHKKCIKCFCCHEMCPVKAIHLKRTLF